ncbi:MAG: ATP-dependent DNA helicase RecG [Candidatus Magnetoglobus multicellularis str. Araruama]|uniref:ATP-dependent DNA helicase RecG n=1 Tax=Candidatus Magnetoglobus multicellularis str. Araruama TaxID=890399 RepID=A0A1V1PAI6_9BACT|nr:MAG: ATP-dependent DNA helicase RecG [Candidatus Magnetoglobus multicellularis str. Araruama]
MKTLETIIQNGENSRVEFKSVSVSPKTLAEEMVAFLNVRGGVIYIGIEDDGIISGIDINRKESLEDIIMNVSRNNITPPIIPDIEIIKYNGKWIAKVILTEGLSKPYQTTGGKYYIRAGASKRISSREELLRLFQNALVCHIDNHPIPGTSLEHLNTDKIKQFFKSVYELDISDMDASEQTNLFINASILTPYDSQIHTSLAGFIFFAQSDPTFPVIQKYIPHAGIQFVYYETNDKTSILDRYTCYHDCPQAIDQIVQKIRINWKTPSTIKGLVREERPFPMSVFRELLVNAVVHRDYSIQSTIYVNMFPDRVEIISPGRLVNTVTIEKMRAGISVSRNPLLMKFMQNYRYADQLGRGIPMIMRSLEKMPKFDIDFIAEDDRLAGILHIIER